MGWSERKSAGRLQTARAVFSHPLATCSWLAAVVICSASAGCSSNGKSGSGSGSGSGSAVAKPLPPLEVRRVMSIPGSWTQEDIYVKPGHWSAAWVEAAANADDFQGDLEVRLEDTGQEETGDLGGPAVRRPLVLPKGEPRAVEGAYFRPWRAPTIDDPFNRYAVAPTNPNLVCTVSLMPRGGRRSDLTTSLQTTELKNHQAIFCVLAAQGARYNAYARLDVIEAAQARYSTRDDVHYRLAIAEDGQRAPLPSLASGWTTIAYLLWDGYDPAKLTEPQQTALIDWLHWGGQMLVSGPGSLNLLERSFLAEHLPARDGGTTTLDGAALAPLGRWSIGQDPALTPTHPWPAVKLAVDGRAERLVPEDGDSPALVVERRFGRGRIVVTAFSLSERDALDWPAFDSVLNGCLMRRAPRTFSRHDDERTLRWTDSRFWLDPTLISNVRYVVRDDGRPAKPGSAGANFRDIYDAEPESGPGVAAWRDDGPVVNNARELLRSEAKIVIPDARFVVTVVGAYFVVLVPLNWLVFRLLGRPEWAWFAAPLIAVACAATVIRLAELDVGFSRSTSEATVVEIQPDYDRAHVSRFVAVYNSLGTEYQVVGEDPSTIALPLPGDPNAAGDPTGWRIRRVVDGDRDQAAVDGFLVESNSVRFLRAEQMCRLGGALRCEAVTKNRYRITNGTRLELTDCRITGAGSGRIERLPPGETVDVELDRGTARSRPGKGATRIDEMRQTLENPPSDELRLTAVTTDDVGGFALSPQPSQSKRTTFVVAHLEYPRTEPSGDFGTRGLRRRQSPP